MVAYRCLTRESSDINAPSFLFESVVNGDQQGRYSFLGAMPAMEVIATGNKVVLLDHESGTRKVTHESDPMLVPEALSRGWKPAIIEGLPQVFTGGWVGYAGYDTVRYVYSGKLPFETAPKDDRGLSDMHLSLYNDVVVFDQATKIIYAISWVHIGDDPASRTEAAVEDSYEMGRKRAEKVVSLLTSPPFPELSKGRIDLELNQRPASPGASNMTEVRKVKSLNPTFLPSHLHTSLSLSLSTLHSPSQCI